MRPFLHVPQTYIPRVFSLSFEQWEPFRDLMAQAGVWGVFVCSCANDFCGISPAWV